MVLGLGIADVVNRSPELLCDRAFLPVRRQAWLQAQAGDFGFEAKDVLEQGLGQPGSGCTPPGLSRRSQTVACLLCKIGVAHNVGLTVFFMVFMVEGKDLLKTHLYLLVVLLHTVHSQLPAAGMEVNAPVFMDACGFLGHLANGIHIAVVGGPGYQGPQIGFQVFVHGIHYLLLSLTLGNLGQDCPELGDQIDLSLPAGHGAQRLALVIKGIDVVFTVPSCLVYDILHFLAAEPGEEQVFFPVKGQGAESLIGPAPRKGKPDAGAFSL